MLQDHTRRTKPAPVECVNRFAQLDQAGSLCSAKLMNSADVKVDLSALSNSGKAFVRCNGKRRLHVAIYLEFFWACSCVNSR